MEDSREALSDEHNNSAVEKLGTSISRFDFFFFTGDNNSKKQATFIRTNCEQLVMSRII